MNRLDHLDLLDGRMALIRKAGTYIARCDDREAREALMEVLLTWSRWASDVSVSTDWTGPLDYMAEAFEQDTLTVDPYGERRLIAESMWSVARDLIALDVRLLKRGDVS